MARPPDVATSGAGGRRGEPWRAAGVVLVALLALTGTALLGAGLNPAPAQPPQPVGEAPADPESDWAAPTPSASAGSARPGTPAPKPSAAVAMPRSEPTGIAIPKIKVNAKIMSLGLNADGTVQVPPLKQAKQAGWYRLGPTPGEIGNAVIVGHVDSASIGPAVFFGLGSLKAGDAIQVTRKDGTVARFTVDKITSYPKTAFPSELVYGTADTAKLQVVTCGGTFDRKKRSYPNNIVVSASLVR